MKGFSIKKLIASIVLMLLVFPSFVNVIQATEDLDTDYNLLVVTNDNIVNGDRITEIISDIGKAYNISVTNVGINSNTPLTTILANISEEDYTNVILQDTFDNLLNSNWDVISNKSIINDLTINDIKCHIGTPWKELTEEEKNVVEEKCKTLFSDSSLKVLDRVYENLLAVKESGIDIANSNGNLTNSGELTLACTYISEITKNKITNLSSYDGISDANVAVIIDKVNSTLNGIKEPSTATSTSTTNTTNTTSQVTSKSTSQSTAKTTVKTTKKTTSLGSLKADSSSLNYTTFKTDREPRLEFVGNDPDYLYIKIKDCGGISSELTGDKKNHPKVYTCTDAKGNGKKEITDIKKPSAAQYKKQDTTYVYMVGIPSKYIGEKKSYFYIVAYDTSKNKNVIREHFGVSRKEDGTFSVDRAPRSVAVTTTQNLKQIGFLVKDYSGVSKIKVRTIKDKGTDTLGEWDGTIQNNWSQVESVTASRNNIIRSITTMTKVSKFFKSRKWSGKNPKLSGQDGKYKFAIDTTDANGRTSTKTMVIDTTLYRTGDTYQKIGTSKKKQKNSNDDDVVDPGNGEIALDRNKLMIDNTHYNFADMKAGVNSESGYKAKDVTWTIDDPSVAKFQKSGKYHKKISGSGSVRVVGLKFGTTTISAKLPNGSTAKCKLKVITSSKEQAKGDRFVNWLHGNTYFPFYLHKGTWGDEYVEAYVNNAAKIVKKYQDSKFKNEAAQKTVWCYRQKSLKFSVDSKKKKVTGISGNEYGTLTPIGHWDFQETGKVKKKGELSPNDYILLFTSKNQWAYLLKKNPKTGEWEVKSSRESAAGYNRDTFEGYLCIMKKEGFIGPAVTYERWGRGESSYQNAVHKDFTSVQGQPQSAGCIRVGFTDQEIYYWVFVKAGVGTRLILF